MSLADLVAPPKAPTTRGRVVRGDRLSPAAEKRKAELLKRQEAQRVATERAANSARMKALHADPEFKAKVSKAASARMKALNADPEFKARMKAKRLSARIAKLKRALAKAESDAAKEAE